MEKETRDAQLAFIGCGVMAESIIAGLLSDHQMAPGQIAASHPRENRRKELVERYGIGTFAENAAAADAARSGEHPAVFLCVKPQRLRMALDDLKGTVTSEQMVLSIVAGARISTIAAELGSKHVVRAMPNTPSQIGAGITAWTCTEGVSETERTYVKRLLSALGRELYVETENMIDMATALSATGPTYIFMVMEALTDAGVHLGFSRDMAKELVQETMLGSVRFAMESHKHPAELRNMVTSPGGTSAEAIYQMEKGTLRTVLSKAVYAAYKRAVDLGKKD